MDLPDFEKLIDDEMREKIVATMELVDGYKTSKINFTYNWSMEDYATIISHMEIMGLNIENVDDCKKFLHTIIDFAYDYELMKREVE